LPIRGNKVVKFGRINMDYSAAICAQVSSLGLGDASFLFTVCVDHRMRVWNPETGHILHTVDILGQERNPQELGKWTIDPTQANLIRIIELGPGQALCVTFSPIGTGEFKFWRVVAKTDSDISVQDAFPKNRFVPDAPSLSDAWTLADFRISEPDEVGMQLWMLWKNNTTYRVQKLELTLTDMAASWRAGCDAVYFDSNLPSAEASGPCDPTDVTEKWLQIIFSPGRFTRCTLETALAIYERGLGKSRKTPAKTGSSLPEAICSVLACTASLDRSPSGGLDYDQFRSSNETHWRRFYRLVVELNKRRGEAVSLVLDSESGTTWVVCADFVSIIRDCSALERLYHNLSKPDDDQRDAATLISTGLSFLDVLPDNILQICNSVLRPELFEDSTRTDLERVQHFSDKAAFWRGLTEEDCTPVVDNLGQNFSLLSPELYEQLFDLVTSEESIGRSVHHPLTEFGRKLAVKATQDSLELLRKVCFSQLLLLVHMEFEFEHEADALHHRLDVGTIYRRLIDVLRRLELLQWLSRSEISVPLRMETAAAGPGAQSSLSRKESGDTQVITALEGSVGHLLGVGDVKSETFASGLTGIVTNLCSPESDVEVSPAHIQCFLLKQNRPDLAFELTPFSDPNPFSTYVQGRVFLALKDVHSAAIHFRKAAIGLSKSGRLSCFQGRLRLLTS
jgi:nuclear pore complex protein Nup160